MYNITISDVEVRRNSCTLIAEGAACKWLAAGLCVCCKIYAKRNLVDVMYLLILLYPFLYDVYLPPYVQHDQ